MKTRTLDLAANNAANNQYTTHLSNLITHDTFGAMSAQDKTKTLNVFENTTIDGKGALLKLMDKNINGTSALLSKGYGATGPTLDSLNRLATSNINARVGDASGTPANRAKVMEDLMNELSNPAQNINQGNRGTCTVTSMTYGLAEKNPAEYARLVTDLAINGQTKLANGDTIQPPADGLAQDNGSRSVGERLLQSSLMTYANPTYQNFNAAALTNPNVNIDGVPPGFGSGMNPDNQSKVLGALHNRKYEVVTEIKYNFVAANKDVLAMTKLELEKRGGPVYTWVDWSSPGSPGSHIVEVTKIENGRVYFRNPWGGNIPGISNGVGPTDVGATPARTPPRRVEDGPNGIESMSTDDYLKGIIGIDIEKGLLFGK